MSSPAVATSLPDKRAKPKARLSGAPIRRLLAPAVIFLLVWMIVPLVMTLYYAFRRYNLMMPEITGFAGITNFKLMFTDPTFWDSLINTLILVGASLMITVTVGLGLAILFNRTFVGRGVARTLAIAPFFVMPVVTGLI